MTDRATGVLETLRALDDYAFEHIVADIWQECQGWATEVTQQSRDHGIDVVGVPPGGSTKTAVQAKRNAAGNNVSVNKVREYNAITDEVADIDAVTIVTTSDFTSAAVESADRLGIKRINGQDLVEIIRRDGGMEIVEWYAAGRPEDW